MVTRLLKICQGCVNRLRETGNPQVDLTKLQVVLYYNQFELVPPDQCKAKCHLAAKGVINGN